MPSTQPLFANTLFFFIFAPKKIHLLRCLPPHCYVDHVTVVEAESDPVFRRWFEIMFHEDVSWYIFAIIILLYTLYLIHFIYYIDAETIPVSAVGTRQYFIKVFFVIFLQLPYCYIIYIIVIFMWRPKRILGSAVGSISYFMKRCLLLYLCNFYLIIYFILYIFIYHFIYYFIYYLLYWGWKLSWFLPLVGDHISWRYSLLYFCNYYFVIYFILLIFLCWGRKLSWYLLVRDHISWRDFLLYL